MIFDLKGWYKNLLGMTLGTVLVQIIPIIASLIIARIYLPSEFGEFSAWLAYVNIFSVALSLRYETSFAILEDGSNRQIGLLTVLLIILSLTIFAFFIFLFFLSFFKLGISFFLCLLASSILAINTSWQAKAAADGFYKKLVLMRAIQACFIAFFQIVCGLTFLVENSLLISYMIGNFGACLLNQIILPIKNIEKINLRKNIFIFLKANRKFAIYGLPAAFLNVMSMQLPLILIAYRFGDGQAGIFALTVKVMGAPISLVGVAVLDVFKRMAAKGYKNKGEFKLEYLRTFYLLFIASCIFVLISYLFAKDIFVLAYGEEWVESGSLAILLLPLFSLRFIASPLSYATYIVQKQHIDLYWQIVLFTVTILAFISPSSFEGAVQLYAYGYVVLYTIYIYMSYCYSKGLKF